MFASRFVPRKWVVVLFLLGASVFSLSWVRLTFPADADYPNRPISMNVGLPAGGTTSLMAEMFRDVAKGYLPKSQPLLIEYKPGAAQAIAADFVFKQPADGYNLLFAEAGVCAKMALDGDKLRFKIEDFAFAGVTGSSLTALVVKKDSPLQTFEEFMSYAKKNPGKLSYGHSGIGGGTNLSFERFKMKCGLDVNGIPLGGGAAYIAGVLGGHVDCIIGAVGNLGDHIIPGGGLKALAIFARDRWTGLPDVPTCIEKGYDVELSSYTFLAAKKGTPQAVMAIWKDVVKKTCNDARWKESLVKAKFVPTYLGPEDTERKAHEEFQTARDVFKKMGLLK